MMNISVNQFLLIWFFTSNTGLNIDSFFLTPLPCRQRRKITQKTYTTENLSKTNKQKFYCVTVIPKLFLETFVKLSNSLRPRKKSLFTRGWLVTQILETKTGCLG